MMDLLQNMYVHICMINIHINFHFSINIVFLFKIHSLHPEIDYSVQFTEKNPIYNECITVV